VLPHGSGKTTKVLVLTADESQRAASVELGAVAPYVSLDEAVRLVTEEADLSIFAGVDRIICQPKDMRFLGGLGRILGPRGLMPNPKLGTVTNDVVKAVSNSMKGEVVVKTAKDGGVDIVVGKVSMGYR
jgi:large subunit ribosomal protein L1